MNKLSKSKNKPVQDQKSYWNIMFAYHYCSIIIFHIIHDILSLIMIQHPIEFWNNILDEREVKKLCKKLILTITYAHRKQFDVGIWQLCVAQTYLSYCQYTKKIGFGWDHAPLELGSSSKKSLGSIHSQLGECGNIDNYTKRQRIYPMYIDNYCIAFL